MIGLKNSQLTSALIHVYPMLSTNLYDLDLTVEPKDLNPILAFIKADSHISSLTLLNRTAPFEMAINSLKIEFNPAYSWELAQHIITFCY